MALFLKHLKFRVLTSPPCENTRKITAIVSVVKSVPLFHVNVFKIPNCHNLEFAYIFKFKKRAGRTPQMLRVFWFSFKLEHFSFFFSQLPKSLPGTVFQLQESRGP